jgi:long-chain acyl-CoA synthetase
MIRQTTISDLEEMQTLPEVFFASRIRRRPGAFLRQAVRSAAGVVTWSTITLDEAIRLVLSVSAYLIKQGVKPGDRVGIISATRIEWSLADLAIQACGGVTVSIYPSSIWNQTRYILNDAGVTALFVENKEQCEKHLQIAQHNPHDSCVQSGVPLISFEREAIPDSFVAWQSLREHPACTIDELKSRWPRRTDLASLVYTSGTTGIPKGVIQSHGNHLSNVRQAIQSGVFEEGGDFFLYLPLAHSFARLMHYVGMLTDTTLGFPSVADPTSSRLELTAVAQDLHAANSWYLPTVPRLFEKIRDSLELKAASKGLGNKLLRLCLQSSQEMYKARELNVTPSLITQLIYTGTDPIRKSIKKRLFGSKFRHAIAGGAKLPIEVNKFFDSLDILVLEGYGLTETCVATHANVPQRRKIGTVGPAFPDVEVKIDEHGEVLMRGPNVTSGYYNLPEETAAAWDSEGWFHTGDIGIIDEDGFLSITGRIKELIITSGGKKIAPAAVEGHLQQAPAVSQIILYGEGKPYLIGLVTILRDEVLRRLSTDYPELKNLIPTQLVEHSAVHTLVWSELEPLNQELPSFQQIKKILILPEDLSVDNEMLTPTQKPRRSVIFSHFAEKIAALYS